MASFVETKAEPRAAVLSHESVNRLAAFVRDILAAIAHAGRQVRVGDLTFRIRGKNVSCSVGRFSYGLVNVYAWQGGGTIQIGDFTSISEITVLIGGDHRFGVTTYPLKGKFLGMSVENDAQKPQPVLIGNDVWIGQGSLILDGSVLGDGPVIGAGSVVAGDVPPYSVYVGSPGRVLRYRFPPETVKRLLESRWWERDTSEILALLPQLVGEDVESFLRKLDNQGRKTG